jgi:hypothetical protein
MKSLFFILLLIAVTTVPGGFSAHAALRSVGPSSADTSSSIAVWVYFTDKPLGATPLFEASPRALARRRAAGFRPDGSADLPVSRQYLQGVERMGGTLRHCFKWDNAASFDLPASAVHTVSA